MNDRYYPAVDEETILMIRRLSASDPDYFTDPDCPYSPELIASLGGKAGEGELPAVPAGFTLNLDNIDGELDRLYNQLRQFGESLERADAAEKNTYFRLSVTLLEKMTELKERAVGVRQTKEFTDTVLRIMEDQLTPDQRTKIMHQLEATLVA